MYDPMVTPPSATGQPVRSPFHPDSQSVRGDRDGPSRKREEREEFFCQLDKAMQDFPNLWVTLTLREDYVAAPRPVCVADGRPACGSRFYMERMGPESGPPGRTRAGRCWPAGHSLRAWPKKLVDDLSQVERTRTSQTVTGQYVEPMQLQVVCYQLWETLEKKGTERQSISGAPEISYEDLAEDRGRQQGIAEVLRRYDRGGCG